MGRVTSFSIISLPFFASFWKGTQEGRYFTGTKQVNYALFLLHDEDTCKLELDRKGMPLEP